jgi:hypothetical protein
MQIPPCHGTAALRVGVLTWGRPVLQQPGAPAGPRLQVGDRLQRLHAADPPGNRCGEATGEALNVMRLEFSAALPRGTMALSGQASWKCCSY